MRDGQEAPSALSPKNRAEIESNIAEDVLDAASYPFITFESLSVTARTDGYEIVGMLKIRGRSKTVQTRANKRGATLVAELALSQPDFGIRPFSAMLGTLKIKPDVRVVLSVPAQ
jgi:polyisoprenoid-binding protein YceI